MQVIPLTVAEFEKATRSRRVPHGKWMKMVADIAKDQHPRRLILGAGDSMASLTTSICSAIRRQGLKGRVRTHRDARNNILYVYPSGSSDLPLE